MIAPVGPSLGFIAAVLALASVVTTDVLERIEHITKRLWKARIFARDVASEDQAFAVVLSGFELGFEPTAAARMISIFHGRVLLSSDAMQAVCVRNRDVCTYFRCVETSDKVATFETLRAGDKTPRRLSYTIEQARRANLIERNATYKAHTEAMLRARAASALARLVYPDLVAGVSDLAEFDDPTEPTATSETTQAETSETSPEAHGSAFEAFRADLDAAKILGDLHAAWQRHAQKLHGADATEAASLAVGDWTGEHGYCVIATEQQFILSGAWGDEERAIADELAALRDGGAIVGWYIRVRDRVEALRDPKAFKTFIARSWAARMSIVSTRPGNAFAKAVQAHEAKVTPDAPPSDAPARAADDPSVAPIVTSKGEVLTTEAAVVAYLSTIDNVVRLENSAKKHGTHPWAFPVLVERAMALHGMGADEADAWVAGKAGA